LKIFYFDQTFNGIKAIENQIDTDRFILDQIIVDENDNGFLKALWENYKLGIVDL